ncbi:methyl-accepting chemotaxis protein [Malikia granosa]|uniref:methyl-accepting chemotaxis protein n=1 Tax=Malikia granosa TaxID=263067 RepID=UPI001472C50F|nr:methyl-accepting chemotaxis protein [Malikia granosa]
MRTNLPITSNAYDFPADQTLISVTDLKGRITYCNSNFVTVSGFLSEELLGQPHNIVRHPDMPEEAFRDMWQTIQGDGLPWSALVKNRRKNGDYYWVRANATPVRDGDRIVGFLSVRTKPAPQEVEFFERLYATMRAEAAAGKRIHVLRHGEVQRKGLAGTLSRLLHPTLKAKLIGLSVWSGGVPVLAYLLGAPWWLLVLSGLVSLSTAAYGTLRLAIAPLNAVIATANKMAAGDLTHLVEVNSKGEIGQLQLALAQLTVSVRTVVRDVRHEVANLRGGAQEIAAGGQDMSSRTESQASNLEQTAASMEQINGTIRQTAHLASEGAAVARETAAVAKRSHEAVVTVADTMQEIADSSLRIGEIVQVIEGVAFQTNILALNAAVEAARAGEQGRGFAVVAAEVRVLAQRASNEAKAIRQLIEESRGRVDAGNLRAAEARNRMDEAMASVQRVTTMLESIHSATQEQANGIAQISTAVTQLDSITQQNAAMVEEFAAGSTSLQEQVEKVHSTIRVFKLVESDTTLAEVDAVELRKQQRQSAADGFSAHLDFDRAIESHHQWRVTLRNSIARKLKVDVDRLRRDDCCDLGRWLHGPAGQAWSSNPVFTRLLQSHRDFHQEAGKIGDLINRNQLREAEQLIGSGHPFHKAGTQVIAGIGALREVANESSQPAAPLRALRPASASAVRQPVAAEADWETF